MALLRRLGIRLPIIQAPMAGTSTPELAAAVSNAGGLGSIALGASTASASRLAIEKVRSLTDRPFQVNLFVHATPVADLRKEAAWLDYLRPLFAEFGADPPKSLRTIYKSFADDVDVMEMLVETKPPIISFHFGLPSTDFIKRLKATGTTLLATATNLDEAKRIEGAGIDVIVAQGYEAGGHRGVFDPHALDPQLGTMALTRLLVRKIDLPVIAAGGIMDGAGISAALDLGAEAVQLGTAFIPCPESSADAHHKAALTGEGGLRTTFTSSISGRPARSVGNRFTDLVREVEAGDFADIPDYPIAYDAGKALHAAAKTKREYGFGAHWAGQGAPLARAMPAADLVELLAKELRDARKP